MHLDVFCEERSGAIALETLVPRIAPGVTFELHVYRGIEDLFAKLPARLRGLARTYAHTAAWAAVVLVDEDRVDCEARKAVLDAAAAGAGLVTRTRWREEGLERYHVVNRLAVEEIEAWFLGDPAAMQASHRLRDAGYAGRERYRNPDAVAGGTWEALYDLLYESPETYPKNRPCRRRRPLHESRRQRLGKLRCVPRRVAGARRGRLMRSARPVAASVFSRVRRRSDEGALRRAPIPSAGTACRVT